MPSNSSIGQSPQATLDNVGLPPPPGFVGEIANFIYSQAIRPVPEVAIAGALGFMAGICGKAFATPEKQTGLNLYIILVARSAIGKEAMHDGINCLNDTASSGRQYGWGEDFVVSEELASEPALMRLLKDKQSLVNVLSEFGHIFASLVSPKANQNESRLRGGITKAYSQSGPHSVIGGRQYADKDKNTGVIGSVAYSLLGETTPSTFYDCITPEIMADGFLSRFVVIEYKGDRPAKNKIQDAPSQSLVEKLRTLMDFATQLQNSTPHRQVQHSDTSWQVFESFDQLCDRNIIAAGDDEARRQAWNRAHLNALKIASILAVGDDHNNPIIQQAHADWAIGLLKMNIATYEERLSSGDIGNGDDARQRKVMQVIAKIFKGQLKDKEPKITQAGAVTHRALYDNTKTHAPFKNHPIGAAKILEMTMASLINNGVVMEVDKHSTVERFGFHGKCYYPQTLD
jgi:hypothetical protein